jgi:hypothetical protein
MGAEVYMHTGYPVMMVMMVMVIMVVIIVVTTVAMAIEASAKKLLGESIYGFASVI